MEFQGEEWGQRPDFLGIDMVTIRQLESQGETTNRLIPFADAPKTKSSVQIVA